MSNFIFPLARYGSSFATREKAKKIGAELSAYLEQDHVAVNLDFHDVSVLSYSFADELIREVAEALQRTEGREARFTNCNDEVLTALWTTLKKRDRLADYDLTATTTRHTLAITRAA